MDLHQNVRLTWRSRETLANKILIEKGTKDRCQVVPPLPHPGFARYAGSRAFMRNYATQARYASATTPTNSTLSSVLLHARTGDVEVLSNHGTQAAERG
jgi:hypothetical protein